MPIYVTSLTDNQLLTDHQYSVKFASLAVQPKDDGYSCGLWSLLIAEKHLSSKSYSPSILLRINIQKYRSKWAVLLMKEFKTLDFSPSSTEDDDDDDVVIFNA